MIKGNGCKIVYQNGRWSNLVGRWRKRKISLGNLNNNMDNDYKLAKDYYSKDNPFKKVIIGASAAAGGSFSATIIALGVSQAFVLVEFYISTPRF